MPPVPVTPVPAKKQANSAKATPKPSMVAAKLKTDSQANGKLVDKWPHLKSAAEWNLEEKEREIRGNLSKMAGINFGNHLTP